MTPYCEVFDLFLSGIKDPKIDRLYQSATPTNADVYMTGFLVKSIPSFTNCKKDLENRDDDTRIFNISLNTDEKVILSNLMIIEWLTKEINDIRQITLHLQHSDAKTYAEANNLKEKSNLRDVTRETSERQIVQYGYKNIDWNMLG